MDPISLAMTGVSVAMSIFGGMKSSSAAGKQAQLSAQNAQNEMQVDQQRQVAMELQSKRQSMEVLRNNQRARSMALNNATAQGAQFGSGLQGGYGAISGQSGVNLLGINQNLEVGENIFALNQKTDQNKIQMAQLGGDIASGQAISSIGKSLGGATSSLTNIAGMFGSSGMKGIG